MALYAIISCKGNIVFSRTTVQPLRLSSAAWKSSAADTVGIIVSDCQYSTGQSIIYVGLQWKDKHFTQFWTWL